MRKVVFFFDSGLFSDYILLINFNDGRFCALILIEKLQLFVDSKTLGVGLTEVVGHIGLTLKRFLLTLLAGLGE